MLHGGAWRWQKGGLLSASISREKLLCNQGLFSIRPPGQPPQRCDLRLDRRVHMGAVIHWPVAFPYGGDFEPLDPNKPDWVVLDTDTSLVDTWQAMIKLRDTGKVKAIGVSNFTPAHI